MSLAKLAHRVGVKLAYLLGMYDPELGVGVVDARHRAHEIITLTKKFGYADSKVYCLDVGAGTGKISRIVAEAMKIRVVALDIDHRSLKNLLKIHKGALNVEPIVADAYHLPFRNYTFDLTFIVSVLEHFAEPEVAVKEVDRVLKNGGATILMLPNLQWSIDTATKWPLLYFMPSFIKKIILKGTGYWEQLNFKVTLKNTIIFFHKVGLKLVFKSVWWHGIRKINFPWPPAWYLVFHKGEKSMSSVTP